MMMITDTEWLVMTNAASLQTDQSQEGKLALALSCNQATHHSAICMVIAILQWLNSQYYHCLIQRNLLYPDRQKTVVTARALDVVLECLCLCIVIFTKHIFKLKMFYSHLKNYFFSKNNFPSLMT